MSIASEITRLQTAKEDIKSSIENKGVTVPSNASIDTYNTYIDQIPTGGGGIEIDPNPTASTTYEFWTYHKTGYSYENKYNKYTFSTGLELPIKWVKNVDGVELVDGTYTLYNSAGNYTNAEFVISTTNKGKVLTFNYLNTADDGFTYCTVNNKRIYICIDVDRASFCTNQTGATYLYAETTGTVTSGTDNGYQTSSSGGRTTLTLDPTIFGGYLILNINSVDYTNKIAYFSFVVIA